MHYVNRAEMNGVGTDYDLVLKAASRLKTILGLNLKMFWSMTIVIVLAIKVIVLAGACEIVRPVEVGLTNLFLKNQIRYKIPTRLGAYTW